MSLDPYIHAQYKHMKQKTMNFDEVDYPLCGGSTCFTGQSKCTNVAVHLKDYDKGYTKANATLVCCFINRLCNENNLRTEKQTKKFLIKNGYIN